MTKNTINRLSALHDMFKHYLSANVPCEHFIRKGLKEPKVEVHYSRHLKINIGKYGLRTGFKHPESVRLRKQSKRTTKSIHPEMKAKQYWKEKEKEKKH